MDIGLDGLVRWVEHHPWLVGVASLVIFLAASAGVWRLEVESDFTKNFRRDSEIVRSYEFVEEHLGGAGVWDVIIPAPQTLDFEFLRRVQRLQQRLAGEVKVRGEQGRERPGLTKSLSLADSVTTFVPNILDEIEVPIPPLTPESMLPTIRERMGPALLKARNAELELALAGMQARIPSFYKALHNEDPQHPGQYWLRVMLRSHERQSSQAKREIIERVARIAREQFPAAGDPHGRVPEATGFFVLLAYLIDNLLADQWLAFLVATSGILLMMLIALRNPLQALVALVPNVAPIMIVTGLMGWVGYKINMGAAMIAAVSMGLSIDSSIHYILSFQAARAEGKSMHAALAAVHHSVGRALIFATLALIAGFSVLCFSEFVPTIYFGALVSLTMLGGLAGNLVVLPLLLKLVTRK
jgi:predicted RND superfamily exporter protein